MSCLDAVGVLDESLFLSDRGGQQDPSSYKATSTMYQTLQVSRV